MAKVKKRKDLTHNQFQMRRSRQYRELMKIELPDTKVDLIVPEMWYIIYEKDLTAPKILKYPFRAKIFADSYARRKLHGVTRYNVLSGQLLIDFGFNRAYNQLRSVGISGDGLQRYDYPEGLTDQRRKTMRTMYRRNYRRLLRKLMDYET